MEIRKSIGPWILRKEISAWSAVVLYITGLLICSKFLFEEFTIINIGNSIFLILLFFCAVILFSSFIHVQFNDIFAQKALQRSIDVWLFEFINKSNIHIQFDETYNLPVPIKLVVKKLTSAPCRKCYKLSTDNDELNEQIKEFFSGKNLELKPGRQLCFRHRLCLPISLIFKKKDRSQYDLLEREEAIIYNILIFINIGIIAYFFLFLNSTCSKNMLEKIVLFFQNHIF